MFPVATIIHSGPYRDIEHLLPWLSAELRIPCSRTEWNAFYTTIAQIHVECALAFRLQPDRPEFVAEDIANLEERIAPLLSVAELKRLRASAAILDIFGADDAAPTISEGVIRVVDSPSISVRDPRIEPIACRIASALDGWLVDLGSIGVRSPNDHAWRDLLE